MTNRDELLKVASKVANSEPVIVPMIEGGGIQCLGTARSLFDRWKVAMESIPLPELVSFRDRLNEVIYDRQKASLESD